MFKDGSATEELPGEGYISADIYKEFLPDIIIPKKLTFDQASRCLSTLGKDESGIRYAYLMISTTDMQLTDISKILLFKHVLFVDVSGNFLALNALDVLIDLPFLIMLKADRNLVRSPALVPMPYLQILTLSKNQITDTRGIAQPYLDSLDLSNNMIYQAEFESEKVAELVQLDLHGNQLIELVGCYPTSVQKLFLASNRIAKLNATDLSRLVNLKILHLRNNKIRKLDGFTGHLKKLTYLNLRSNQIKNLRQFNKLRCLPNLETLIVTDNPVCGLDAPSGGEEDEEEDVGEEEDASKSGFRISLLVMLPRLKRINKVPVSPEERDEAFFVEDERYQAIMGEPSSDEDEPEMPTTTTDYYTTETESESK